MTTLVLKALPLWAATAGTVGLVVAAPTLLASSVPGRMAGVVCGAAVLALLVRVGTTRARSSTTHVVHLGGQVFTRDASGPHDPTAASAAEVADVAEAVERFRVRARREERRLRMRKGRYLLAIVLGGLLGAVADSFLATVALVAAGLAAAMATDLARGLLMMRRMSDPRRLFGETR